MVVTTVESCEDEHARTPPRRCESGPGLGYLHLMCGQVLNDIADTGG